VAEHTGSAGGVRRLQGHRLERGGLVPAVVAAPHDQG
jgi:hypothetical protein